MNAVEIRRIGATNFVQTTRAQNFIFFFTAETFLREKRKQYFIKKFHNFLQQINDSMLGNFMLYNNIRSLCWSGFDDARYFSG